MYQHQYWHRIIGVECWVLRGGLVSKVLVLMVLRYWLVLILIGVDSIPTNTNTVNTVNTYSITIPNTNTQDWCWLVLVCLISRHRLGILILTNTGLEYWY